MGNAQIVLDELQGPTRSLRPASSGAWAGFATLHDAALADGALPRRTKELIALTIAVTRECDGCIISPAMGAARYGATLEARPTRVPVAPHASVRGFSESLRPRRPRWRSPPRQPRSGLPLPEEVMVQLPKQTQKLRRAEGSFATRLTVGWLEAFNFLLLTR
jgi:AhpD family alkylhydroperoxidase